MGRFHLGFVAVGSVYEPYGNESHDSEEGERGDSRQRQGAQLS